MPRCLCLALALVQVDPCFVGPTVTIASWLQRATKHYDVPVLCSEQVCRRHQSKARRHRPPCCVAVSSAATGSHVRLRARLPSLSRLAPLPRAMPAGTRAPGLVGLCSALCCTLRVCSMASPRRAFQFVASLDATVSGLLRRIDRVHVVGCSERSLARTLFPARTAAHGRACAACVRALPANRRGLLLCAGKPFDVYSYDVPLQV